MGYWINHTEKYRSCTKTQYQDSIFLFISKTWIIYLNPSYTFISTSRFYILIKISLIWHL